MSLAEQSASAQPGSSPELVIVFARSPRLGQVKSRLAATLGAPAALQAYRELLEHALAAAAGCPDVERWLCLTGDDPDGEAAALALRFGLRVVEQSGADLGERMARALRAGLAGHSRVVLIGCDCPPIDAAVLRAALQALASHDMVFGPTEDGGYALIGTRAPCDGVFASIDWGSARVMAQTRERLRAVGLSAFEMPTLWDVDEALDWARFKAWRAQSGKGGH
ncbi:MAG: TIGR04282 family arsenosugar biosynthesis glycosyltransferase [Burkholderiaceae bacterium]|nr:TIGR04282 family arsenosugar biosynthesis glycosyltransferase [Burkholderiaceae bacterium]